MTSGELITRVQQELKGLSSKFIEVDFVNAAVKASVDTGWVFPQTTDYRIKWLTQRTKRHLYEMLQSESAHKFKVDGINLQQRFDHYSKLIEVMDGEWEKEQEGIMDLASGVGGVKITHGFVYDNIGQDISGKNSSTVYPSSED